MNKNLLEILIATSNPGKVVEIRNALASLPIKLRQLDEFPEVLPVEEVGHTYQENAALKALGYAKQFGLSALADDSGLEVDALNGRPGVLSARFGGGRLSDKERTQELLEQLLHVSDSNRTARFVCSVVLVGWAPDEDQTELAPRFLGTAQGYCQGKIIKEARGQNGFGYDPVFVPDGYAYTFAELPPEIKRQISHRAKAINSMRLFLEALVRY